MFLELLLTIITSAITAYLVSVALFGGDDDE